MARSRAYRWGEDALCCGITDRESRLCFGLALWNGRDPILKERLFGLSGPEGNHGEDVKELYSYVECTPTCSWFKTRYFYPFEYPYNDLTSRKPGLFDKEFEIEDTNAFQQFWDVQTEVAKETPDCIFIRITVENVGGPPEATMTLIPQLTFRNTWSWGNSGYREEVEWGKPKMSLTQGGDILCSHKSLGEFVFEFVGEKPAQVMFTENETNSPKLFGAHHEAGKVYKDAFHEFIIHGKEEALSKTNEGTKAGGAFLVKGRASFVFCLHRADVKPTAAHEKIFSARKSEHDEYYDSIMPKTLTMDEKQVYLRAAAGLLFSKQFYYYDVRTWLNG